MNGGGAAGLGGLKRQWSSGLGHGAALRLKDGGAMKILEPRMGTNAEGTVGGVKWLSVKGRFR